MRSSINIIELNKFHTETLLIAIDYYYKAGFRVNLVAPHIGDQTLQYLRSCYGINCISLKQSVLNGSDFFHNTIENPKSLFFLFITMFLVSSHVSILIHNLHFVSQSWVNLTIKRKFLRIFLKPVLLLRCKEIFILSNKMKFDNTGLNSKIQVLTNSAIKNFARWSFQHFRGTSSAEIPKGEFVVVLGSFDVKKKSVNRLIAASSEFPLILVLGKSNLTKHLSDTFMSVGNIVTFDRFLEDIEFYTLLHLSSGILDVGNEHIYGPFKTSASEVIANSCEKTIFL